VKYKRRKSRNRAALAGILLAVTGPHSLAVPLAHDLYEDGRSAERDCKPLLLEFSDTGCSYCRLLEEEVLDPTLLNRDYDRRVLMRKLLIDRHRTLRDFDGESSVDAQQLAQRYKVRVTPTLVFVDARGQEIAERMVGVTTLDMYGGYLDLALDSARRKLQQQQRCDD
jgi:thioredoxin-related protein